MGSVQPVLRGRTNEREQLERLLGSARTGTSAVLVLRGEAGVGKTALLRWTAERASDFRIAQITGVESEMELAFAALHQLCAPLLDRADILPEPQQKALKVALGLAAGDPPDRFLVALAALSLLCAAAEEQPLLCFVDDLQWVDDASSQVLGFVARRLLADPVAFVFAVREPNEERRLGDLPELWLEGLDERDSRALLETVIPGPLDVRVRERILAETRGNPLALLELPRGISAADLAGGFLLPGPATLMSSLEDSFRRRLEPLPTAALRLLQLAAADPVGEPLLLWRAAAQLGIGPIAAAIAQESGLLEIGAQVLFRHPLVRSAAYRSASRAERHQLHAALADATDPALDPDRHAWHRARAVLGPDEEVAAELERSAVRAHKRGGIAAAAAFLDNAATLTPDPAERVRRLLVAARTMRDAGQLDAGLERLSAAEAGPLSAREQAEAEELRGEIAFDQRRMGEAVHFLLSAARHFEPLDRIAARTTQVEAIGAAMWAGDWSAMRETAAAVRAAATPPSDPPTAADALLDALATRFSDGYAAAGARMRQAVDMALELEPVSAQLGQWLWLTGSRGNGALALEIWDDAATHAFASRQVQVARDTGALVGLQFALNFLARSHILGGDLAAAAGAIEEQRRIAAATGRPAIAYTEMMLAAWRGREEPAMQSIERERAAAAAYGQGRIVNFADCAAAVLGNGLGRYEAALEAARRAYAADHPSYLTLVAPELAEAAARTGARELLESLQRDLAERSRVTPGDWLHGIQARVEAFLATGDEAERLYLESIERLARTRIRAEQARARLLYGEWLRREGRRVDAREQLRVAREALLAMGAEAFAERARHELLATGEKVRKRGDDTRDELTPQEEQIARLAREGRTNPEIGAELFLSPRTVEWHLKKVFTKLGIASRRELRDALPVAA